LNEVIFHTHVYHPRVAAATRGFPGAPGNPLDLILNVRTGAGESRSGRALGRWAHNGLQRAAMDGATSAGRETPHGSGRVVGVDCPAEKNKFNQKERSAMSLISLFVTLIVIGVILWLVNTYIPMDGKIKSILNAVVVICVVVWLLSAFGVLGHAHDLRVPQIQ